MTKDLVSEQQVLQYVTLKGENLDLEVEDFADENHQRIWVRLQELFVKGRAITPENVLKKLDGGARKEYVALSLSELLPMNISMRVKVLKEKRVERDIKNTLYKMEDLLRVGEMNPCELAEYGIEKLKTIAKLQRGPQTLTDQLREFVRHQSGTFSTLQATQSVTLRHSQKDSVRKILRKLWKRENIIEPTGRVAGEWRIKDGTLDRIDWKNATSDEVPFVFPMGISNHFRLMPKNIVTIAGESDAGKTAMALNIACANTGKLSGIHYFSSEMGEQELRSRLEQFELCEEDPIPLSHWEDINFYDRVTNFQDVIVPDGINIIDYLHMREEFYLIGKHLDEIYEKLTTGVAIVLIQKKKGADYGYGAELTIQKARLSINLENGFPHHTAKLNKVKNWRNSRANPNGLVINYNLLRGCQFITKGGWYRPEEKEQRNEQGIPRRGARQRPRPIVHSERNSESNSFDSHFGKVDG